MSRNLAPDPQPGRTMLCGRPLTFGDAEQIAELKRLRRSQATQALEYLAQNEDDETVVAACHLLRAAGILR